MAKRVFFSFHYLNVQEFRANVVRNHSMTKADVEAAGYYDASIWEKAETKGALAVKELIHEGLKNTTVTAVLVGTHTYLRRWVRYEIVRSGFKGNKILAVHINGIPDKNTQTKSLGPNPLDYLAYYFSSDGKRVSVLEFQNSQWISYADFAEWELETPSLSLANKCYKFSELYPIYDWQSQDGYNNFASWIE